MRSKKFPWWVVVVLPMLASACNIGIPAPASGPTVDVNAVFTAAAETMISQFGAQQTQTAQAIPPSPLPSSTALPSFTPLPTFAGAGTPFGATPFGAFTPLASAPAPIGTASGPLCNDSGFVTENYPDGSKLKPGEDFKKVWALQNTGTCMWDDGYVFTFAAGDKLDGYNVPIEFTKDFVKPGEVHNFAVNLTAHLALGTYQGCWKMKDDHGYFFGTFACVSIEVVK